MGRPVILWLQQAFRLRDNPALQEALRRAADAGGGVVVLHGFDEAHPLGSPRVNRYVMEAALETLAELEARGAIVRELPADAAHPLADQVVAYAAETRAESIVVDDPVAYIPKGNIARARALMPADVPLIEVEANVIVPTRLYPKAAYGAYTIRKHLQREAERALRLPASLVPDRFPRADAADPPGIPIATCDPMMYTDGTRHPDAYDIGVVAGERAALDQLDTFVSQRLGTYDARRDALHGRHHSELSAHLHVGAISPRIVARAVLTSHAPDAQKQRFLEQLIVRRELAFNAARFHPSLRTFDALPEWARATLHAHDGDRRSHTYDSAAWARADTHDETWNATQLELRHRGTIHPYLRMVWGKKIIEWSATHAEALRVMEELNGAWAFDGRSAPMWTNHLWCFGLHDRPFGERPVFGKIRWMSTDGTARKFDMKAYIAWTAAGCPVEGA